MDRLSILLLSLSATLAAGGQLLLKVGAHQQTSLVGFFNLPLFFGLMLYACGMLIWIYALSFEKLVNVYAFAALTFVLVYIGGVILLEEHLTGPALAGVLLVLTGIALIARYNN